ncbi:MAG: hypothetical protein ACPHAN_07450, partial [Pseudomonadales bacterium]
MRANKQNVEIAKLRVEFDATNSHRRAATTGDGGGGGGDGGGAEAADDASGGSVEDSRDALSLLRGVQAVHERVLRAEASVQAHLERSAAACETAPLQT